MESEQKPQPMQRKRITLKSTKIKVKKNRLTIFDCETILLFTDTLFAVLFPWSIICAQLES